MLEDEVEPEAGVSDGQALVAQKTRERLWRVLNTENSNGILGLEEQLHSIRILTREKTGKFSFGMGRNIFIYLEF